MKKPAAVYVFSCGCTLPANKQDDKDSKQITVKGECASCKIKSLFKKHL